MEAQLKKLERDLEAFVRAVTSLEEETFLRKFTLWSPRDVVAHLIGWNRYVIEGSQQIREGRLPSYDLDPGENYANVNAALIQLYSSTDRKELIDELRRASSELREFLQTLDPADWDRDFGVSHGDSILTIEATVAELVRDYSHHRQQIEEWVQRGSQRQR